MKRNPNGKFAKALVRVGDLAVCSNSGFNPGFTKDKPYKVIATFRSHYENRSHYDRYNGQMSIKRENEFAVIDNDGLFRILSLIVDTDSEWRKNSGKLFGEWMILP